MFVLDCVGNQLRCDGSELDGPRSQPLRGFPYVRVLHFTGRVRTDDLRHNARFQKVMQDMPARKTDAACAGAGKLRMSRFKSGHATRRITCPRLTADILIEPAVAIRNDVEAR